MNKLAKEIKEDLIRKRVAWLRCRVLSEYEATTR